MRRILDEKDEAGATNRERIFRHQVEAAQAWEVRVVGRDGDGELLKVASARDSTIAAEFVLGLIGIKPVDVEKNRLALAEHIRSVARDQIEVIKTMLGARLATMTPEEIGIVISMSEQGDSLRFIRAAQQTLAQASQVEGETEPAEELAALPEPSKPEEPTIDSGCAHELCSGCSECEPEPIPDTPKESETDGGT